MQEWLSLLLLHRSRHREDLLLFRHLAQQTLARLCRGCVQLCRQRISHQVSLDLSQLRAASITLLQMGCNVLHRGVRQKLQRE